MSLILPPTKVGKGFEVSSPAFLEDQPNLAPNEEIEVPAPPAATSFTGS